jgi:hypothetical protein
MVNFSHKGLSIRVDGQEYGLRYFNYDLILEYPTGSGRKRSLTDVNTTGGM